MYHKLDGKFLVIEGIDGSGKSTLIDQFLRSYFAQRDIIACFVHDPGSTKISEKIREILLSRDSLISDRCELLLLYAARVQMIEEIILPALQRNIHVVSDRFISSTVAYQGWGRGMSLSDIDALNKMFLSGCKPDYTIYLDVDPQLIKHRKSTSYDRIEQEDTVFFDRVRSSYLHQAETQDNFFLIDALQEYPKVCSDVTSILSKIF